MAIGSTTTYTDLAKKSRRNQMGDTIKRTKARRIT
jgi:hypothetical protein